MDMIVEVTGNGIKPGECGWICSSIGYTRLDSRRALRSYFNRKEEENERRTKNDV